MSITLVLGGTRSGKSARAETLAAATGLPVRYVATADPSDPAMRERIAVHAARRPSSWITVDAGPGLADTLQGAGECCVLVDGLGTWIATRLHQAGAFADPERLPRVTAELIAELDRFADGLSAAGAAIVVAEQAGEGVLPGDAASRAWLDVLGTATQRLAARAERVELVIAGRALALAPSGGVTEPADGPLRHHGDRDVRPGDSDHAVTVIAGGPPAWLRAVLTSALAHDAERYPREDAAVSALSARHGRAPEEIVPTNGAGEALWLLGPALAPTLVACLHPAFTESEAALRTHGIPVHRVQLDPDHDFAIDPSAVPESADLVIVGNPASPSGTLAPAATIRALRRPGRTVVVDEAFMALVPGEPESIVREAHADVIVVRSLTKVLGIPGLRAGYVVAPAPLAQRLRAFRPPWSVNALALAALVAAAGASDEIDAIARRAVAEREDLERRLQPIRGVRVWPAAANFILIAVPDGPRVLAALRARSIAVRGAATFPGLGENHLRITAREPRRNAQVAETIAAEVGG